MNVSQNNTGQPKINETELTDSGVVYLFKTNKSLH